LQPGILQGVVSEFSEFPPPQNKKGPLAPRAKWAFLYLQENFYRIVFVGWLDGRGMVSGKGATACGADDGDDGAGTVAGVEDAGDGG